MGGRRMCTSCRPCQKARIGCDAVLQKDNPCTNCVRRGKVCCAPDNRGVLQRRRQHPNPAINGSPELTENVRSLISRQEFVSSSRSDFELEDVACRSSQALLLHDMLWDIFVSVFESRFAMWLSDSCCPYLDVAAGTKSFLSRIALQLDGDQYDSNAVSTPGQSNPFATPSKTSNPRNCSALLNDGLRYAIYAYSARWLPLRSAFESSNAGDAAKSLRQQQDIRDQLWRRARQNIFFALLRPSYRSILTLLLFTLTEMPVHNDDPGLGHLCGTVLLHHFNRLRSPFKISQEWPLALSTSVLPRMQGAVDFTMPERRHDIDQNYQHLENSVFWLGVVCDTSRCLIYQTPSVVLPGRSGDWKVWDFIRQRTVIFDQSFRVLHNSLLPLPPDIIVVVLQHASACKAMYLGVLNQFCDAAFRNGECVDAARRVSEESRRFHDVFDQLLAMCARDYLTMNSESQLHYLLLVAHYNLGNLIFADALDSLDTMPESLRDSKSLRQQACTAIVNALSLAMNCDRYSQDDSPYGSILLLDPTPELMVEVLSRAGKGILSLHQTRSIRLRAAQIMLSVVSSSLAILAKVSVTASFVLSSLDELSSKQDLKIKCDNQSTSTGHIASSENITLLSLCDSAFIDEFLRETQVQANMNLLSLDSTIKKYENLKCRPRRMSEEVRNVDDLFVSCSAVLEASTSVNPAGPRGLCLS